MISVIMPVYNAQKFLRETIDSLLRQTERDFELILVDDGSTDRSAEIIRSYQDSRIRYHWQENQGASAARNAALELATGEFIAFQDADDLSLPHRLEFQRKQFTSENIGFVHSDMLLIDERNAPIGYWLSRSIEKARLLRFFLQVGTPYNFPTLMIRRSALGSLRFNPLYKIGEDTDLLFRLAPQWDSVHVAEPLVMYRRHQQNATMERDYDVLHLHVHHLIESHSLMEFFPELYRGGTANQELDAKAHALMALFLKRRGMQRDASLWYEKAMQAMNVSEEATHFVIAIGNLIMEEPRNALNFFRKCNQNDPIVLNYLGECHALLKEMEQAYECFQQAVKLYPYYEEAIENLKDLAVLGEYHLLDPTWKKFLVNGVGTR